MKIRSRSKEGIDKLPRDRSSHKLVESIDDVSRCLRIVDNVDKEKHQVSSKYSIQTLKIGIKNNFSCQK